MSNRLEYYNDEKGDYRWRVKAGNNKVVSASDEGFSSLRKAMDNYQLSLRPVVSVTNNTKDQDAQGHLADNAGSAQEEGPDTNSGEAGTGGSEGSISSSDASDSGSGDSGSKG